MADEQKLIIKTIADTKGFTSGLNRMQSGLKKLGGVFSAVGGAYAASKIFNIGKDLVKVSAELETVNRSFERSFGSLTKTVDTELNQLSDTLGRSTTVLKKGAISFNSFFQGLGFASQEAAKMSVSMQSLSVDLASFFGIQDTNAQKRFIAALAGSPEVLDQYGINLKQTALQQELYNMGLKTTVQNTSEVVKTQARLNVIMRSMTAAGILGDAARAATTYAGKIKELNANFLKFKENIGGTVKPLASFIVDVFNDLLKEFNDDVKAIADNIIRLRESLGINSDNDNLRKEFGMKSEKEEEAENIKKSIKLTKDFAYQSKVLNMLGKEKLELFYRLTEEQKKLSLLAEMNNDEATRFIFIQNQLQVISKEIAEREKARADSFASVVKESEKRIEILKKEFEFQKELQKIDELKYRDLLDQVKLQNDITDEMSLQFRNSEKESKEYEKQLILLARIKAAIARKRDAGDTPTPMKKVGTALLGTTGEGSLKTDPKKLNELIPDKLGAANESLFEWESIFDNTGFLEQLTLFQDGIAIFDHIRFDFVNGVKQMGVDLAQNMASGFGNAVAESLNGNKKFVDAIRIGTKKTLIAQSADLAAQAVYYGIIGAALAIGGAISGNGDMIKRGAGYLKTAAMLGAGAAATGALGKSIKGEAGLGVNGTGGNGNNGIGGRGGTFEDFMNAIQGEQVFRLAGNDLVTAINRTNTFQGSIGG